MNIFVAGVHGVGKTYLASQLPAELGLVHTSASKLIKEERTMPAWSVDKRVDDVAANQVALAAAVKRHNDAGTRLLLDGHFVLLDKDGHFSRLEAFVFKPLNLQGVVLLEDSPQTISNRIRERDGQHVGVDHLTDFIDAERLQAQAVCEELKIPLVILHAPSVEHFTQAVIGHASM